MNIKEQIYSRSLVPASVEGLMSLFEEVKINFSWCLEAGCHQAADTLRLAQYPQFEMFYLFEPDPVSYQHAKNNLKALKESRYVIRQVALADKFAQFDLIGDGQFGGEGSLITEKSDSKTSVLVDSMPADEIVEKRFVRDGLLWLDVEGFAYPALKGGLKTLDFVLAAKIEVEFANMNDYRHSNFKNVVELMSDKGFVLIKANLNPCFFGDLLFIHKSELNLHHRITGYFFQRAVIFLHGFTYKLLRKPGY